MEPTQDAARHIWELASIRTLDDLTLAIAQEGVRRLVLGEANALLREVPEPLRAAISDKLAAALTLGAWLGMTLAIDGLGKADPEERLQRALAKLSGDRQA